MTRQFSSKTMRESQDGSFFGLGIIISVRRDGAGRNRLTVISPIDGMPAKKLGIRPGDIIAAINGQVTDELTLDDAVAKLRGDKGTSQSPAWIHLSSLSGASSIKRSESYPTMNATWSTCTGTRA